MFPILKIMIMNLSFSNTWCRVFHIQSFCTSSPVPHSLAWCLCSVFANDFGNDCTSLG